ncbi:MAG TPA: porin family protein [Gemmatimonadales bacterium]|nr:porin family protein [Gemmatimonadales bacterium]
MSAHRRENFARRAAALGVVAACVCATSVPAGAQERAAVGAEVGYSRADLTGEASDLVESRQGAITGVYLHLPASRVLSVRPELLFSLRGGRALVLVEGSITELDIELAYLEFPLLARAVLPRGRVRPAVFGGPSVALQIGCDLVFTFSPDSTGRFTCGQEQATSQVREWDLAWIAGAALELHLPRTTLALQGRYTAGFRSILEGPVDLRNRGIAVLFGLTF